MINLKAFVLALILLSLAQWIPQAQWPALWLTSAY